MSNVRVRQGPVRKVKMGERERRKTWWGDGYIHNGTEPSGGFSAPLGARACAPRTTTAMVVTGRHPGD